jgi:hypothetical protein
MVLASCNQLHSFKELAIVTFMLNMRGLQQTMQVFHPLRYSLHKKIVHLVMKFMMASQLSGVLLFISLVNLFSYPSLYLLDLYLSADSQQR